MDSTITSAFVQQFHDSFVDAAQQEESRLVATITNRGGVTGSSFTANDMGTVEVSQVTNRYGDTEWTIPDAGVRQALMADYDIAIPVDQFDLPKLLANPQGIYLKHAMAAMHRKSDAVVFAALLGSALRKTSDTASYSGVTLASYASGQQVIAAGGTAFTKAKIIQARKLFRKNESDSHNSEELFIAYNSEMLDDVLSDTTLTSADYMAVKMLQEGDVSRKWCGFTWVPYESITASGGTAITAAWTRSSLHFGYGMNPTTDIGPRRDKRNLTQIYAAMSLGAVRVNEQKVVSISFTY